MKKNRLLTMVVMLALALVLAACGQQAQTEAGKPAPDGFVTLRVGVDGGSLAPQGLTPSGIPYDPISDNQPAADTVELLVYDVDENQISFIADGSTYTYTTETSGVVNVIELNSTANEVELVLPSAGNPYTFESRGLDTGTNVIAFGNQEENVSINDSIMLELESVLGAAVLTPRYPTNIVLPGQNLDLMLTVMANGNTDFDNDDYLQVPLSDFTAAYDSLTGATEVSTSNRGLRINIDDTCFEEVTVTGTVSGLVDSNGDYVPGSLDINGTDGYTIDCQAAEGTLAVDLEAPVVTLSNYDSDTGELTGTADDDYGIALVQVFDGPVLLASTDEDEIEDGATEITFGPNSTNFSVTLTSEPIDGLTVIAHDHSGNQGSTAELSVQVIFVDPTQTQPGNGGPTSPFSSLADAIDAAEDGWTIHLAAGTYSEQVVIDKDITLIGVGRDQTILTPPSAADWNELQHRVYAMVYVLGQDTTLTTSGITMQGWLPNKSGLNYDNTDTGVIAAAISVAPGATLDLTDALITETRISPGTRVANYGIAIFAGHHRLPLDGGTVNLTDVDISKTARYAITVGGSDAELNYGGGSLTGEYRVPAYTHLGIGVYNGANATVQNVNISGYQWNVDSNTHTSGVYIETTGDVTFENNTFSSNDRSITIMERGADSTFVDNSFQEDPNHPKNVFIHYTNGSEEERDQFVDNNAFPTDVVFEQFTNSWELYWSNN